MANGIDRCWCLYVHITPNNKYYFGITSVKPEQRWGKNGSRYKSSPYFYNAIMKYGWDNIQHIVTASCLTEAEAKQLETLCIKQFNTNDHDYGYNLTLGGDGTKGLPCPEYRKDILRRTMSGKKNPMYGKPAPNRRAVQCITTGEIFNNVTLAAQMCGTCRSDINKVCTGRRRYAGNLDGKKLRWRYIELDSE